MTVINDFIEYFFVFLIDSLPWTLPTRVAITVPANLEDMDMETEDDGYNYGSCYDSTDNATRKKKRDAEKLIRQHRSVNTSRNKSNDFSL